MKRTKPEFGRWIRELRMAKNIRQQALAKAIGFKHSQSIANIESGRAPFPPQYIHQFCKTLGVDENIFIKKMVQDFEEQLIKEAKKVITIRKIRPQKIRKIRTQS